MLPVRELKEKKLKVLKSVQESGQPFSAICWLCAFEQVIRGLTLSCLIGEMALPPPLSSGKLITRVRGPAQSRLNGGFLPALHGWVVAS